jgi:CCR4-NOT transcription complex subunit 7/8
MRPPRGNGPEIRDVWATNLEQEFLIISDLVPHFPYIGMDTEFPGFLVRGLQSTSEAQRYHIQAVNVNLTRIIQVGVTLADRSGRMPSPCATWQFNFKFSLNEDLYAPDAINLLQRAEVNFANFEQQGIELVDFAYLLLSSGLVMSNDIIWVSFHGGYDFAYLLRMLTGLPLPRSEADFFKLLQKYFPHFYDVKFIISKTQPSFSSHSLSELAESLNILRPGVAHQAGSDSFVTLQLFFKYLEQHYASAFPQERFENNLFGL